MWDWVDHLGGVVFRASGSAAVLSSLAVLAMLGCRQPARRITLARAALLGSLALIPLVELAPLPRFDVVAALRDLGVVPHPLLSRGFTDETGRPSATSWPGASGLVGRWPSRVLLGLYLVGVGAGLAGLALGYWGLGWLTRQSTAPSPRAQALYDEIPFPGRKARPRLRVATRVRRPVLLGVLRPTILIPAALDAGPESPDATEALRLSFLHELAHAERADPWFSLAGGLAQAFWFFLPPLWWIRARMRLDHEFLADRRAALGFAAPGDYAASLLEMATPRPERSEPSPRAPHPVGGETTEVGSPLFQRVLMLVQCPFPVEHRPPAWWRWSLPLLALLIIPASACLRLDLAAAETRSLAPVARTFRVTTLALGPRSPGPLGRAPVFELPLLLPDQFDLALEVWGDRATLARCRVVGQRLGPPEIAPGGSFEPAAWHHVAIRRDSRGVSLAVDGRAVSNAPGLAGLTRRLAVEPAPDRPALFRNLRITWNSAPIPSR